VRHPRTAPAVLLLAALLTLGVACGADDAPTDGTTNGGTGDPGSETTVTAFPDSGQPQTTGSVATPSTTSPEGG
jgi:hypothetical protein